MTQIQLDANLAGRLKSSATPLELCDPSGAIVGIFTPTAKSKIAIPFTEEEIAKSKQKKGGRPLADILADLEKSLSGLSSGNPMPKATWPSCG